MNAGTHFSRWTGKHDAEGHVFPASKDLYYAWSAAFISYVMREAGTGPQFPYSAAHAFYVDAGWHADRSAHPRYAFRAERVETYAPETGDSSASAPARTATSATATCRCRSSTAIATS